MFECQTCQRYFSRTAGTPLGEKHLKKLDLFVSLLSQPLSYRHAGEQMGSLSSDIGERVRVWRAWLLQLDPSGSWERSVRLGGRPTELASTPLAFDEIGAQEDQTLTARLTHEFDELNSRSRQTRFDECPNGAFPHFRCANYKTKFIRRRGTRAANRRQTEPC
ncbi:DUF746 domain-containing protein [Burkholderia gladioli]|nr:DUF746 domain-containing protein [Burkholderia gladioli]MDN7755357.1 DUF746 domain-containing protein [Burkholderia gladioli]